MLLLKTRERRPIDLGFCFPVVLAFFQVINHGVLPEAVKKMLDVAIEFFSLSVEEMLKLYSDDPLKIGVLGFYCYLLVIFICVRNCDSTKSDMRPTC